jgi:integrase
VSVILKGKNPNRPHTVRYWVDGKQREKSFATAKEAKDFKIKTDHDVRAQIFTDPRLGQEDFCAAAELWLSRQPINERTRRNYRGTYNQWVKPAFKGRRVTQVAGDRDGVEDLLTVRMAALTIGPRTRARRIIVGTIEAAVKAQKITRHSLADIELYDGGPKNGRRDFVFPTHAQTEVLAQSIGLAVWLMRGCGLRIEEALAVHREDFRSSRTLRVSGQATRNGREKVALKARKAGEFRDVIVPGWLWEKVKDLPPGPLCPGHDRPYKVYNTVTGNMRRAVKKAGIPAGFRSHSLRHAYASTLLSRGVPITDVARWLGHKNINVTYATYSHFMPEAEDRAVTTLDAEYAEWSKAA